MVDLGFSWKVLGVSLYNRNSKKTIEDWRIYAETYLALKQTRNVQFFYIDKSLFSSVDSEGVPIDEAETVEPEEGEGEEAEGEAEEAEAEDAEAEGTVAEEAEAEEREPQPATDPAEPDASAEDSAGGDLGASGRGAG